MSGQNTSNADRAFELLEQVTAMLLGLSTMGNAVASIQPGQRGGIQLEASAEANAITTDAAPGHGRAAKLS